MKGTRWWSLRRLRYIIYNIPKLLSSPNIPLLDKLLLVIPAVIYWIIPDVLPFIPIDDAAVTLLLMNWFVSRAERKYMSVNGDNERM